VRFSLTHIPAHRFAPQSGGLKRKLPGTLGEIKIECFGKYNKYCIDKIN
jgi:hypothetical protein